LSTLFLLTSADTITFKHEYLVLKYHDFELTQEIIDFPNPHGPMAQKELNKSDKI